MQIEKKKLSDLNPAPYNPRTISDAALAGLTVKKNPVKDRDNSYLVGNNFAQGKKWKDSPEFREKVIGDARNMGLVAAAKDNGISPPVLIKWCKEAGISFRKTGKNYICPICHKEFIGKANQKRVCCSLSCKRLLETKEIECKTCGKKFRVARTLNRKYCSPACYSNSMRKASREKKRRGSNWSTIRRKFESKLCLCELCGVKKATDLHHIIPFKFFHGDYERANQKTNLAALCQDCHHKAEKYARRTIKLIEDFTGGQALLETILND